jgi:GNAT superfamily N-acetyltransferase
VTRLRPAVGVGIVIRPMRPGDAEAVARLTTQLGYPVEAGELAERMAAIVKRGRESALLVAVDGSDAVVGWIHAERLRLLELPPTASISGLVVDERKRSAGIGAALLAAAEDWARAQGMRSIQVRSRTTREGAHRFYEREGYRRIKTSFVFGKALL